MHKKTRSNIYYVVDKQLSTLKKFALMPRGWKKRFLDDSYLECCPVEGVHAVFWPDNGMFFFEGNAIAVALFEHYIETVAEPDILPAPQRKRRKK